MFAILEIFLILIFEKRHREWTSTVPQRKPELAPVTTTEPSCLWFANLFTRLLDSTRCVRDIVVETDSSVSEVFINYILNTRRNKINFAW